MRLLRLLVLLTCFVGTAARAQPGGSIVYVFEAGAAVAASDAGLGLVGGVARKTAHFSLGASLEMIIMPGASTPQYQNDEMLGVSTCKNRQTGEAVSDLLCRGVTAAPAILGSLEAMPFKSLPLVIGAGYRVGKAYGPVATMAVSAPQARSRNSLRLTMMAGPDYFSARFGVMIPQR